MSNNEARTVGTCGIWFAVMVLGAVAITNAATLGGVLVFLIVATIAAMAVGGMQFVWSGTSQSDSEKSEKVKRRSKVDRMLEKLNDDDLNELRDRLMRESDGETVSLEELMRERKQRGE